MFVAITNNLQFQLTRPVRGEPAPLAAADLPAAFQLTRPVRGEPEAIGTQAQAAKISTHSPRAGRTREPLRATIVGYDFNSLAPCGANPVAEKVYRVRTHFNSLAPCGANHDEKTE